MLSAEHKELLSAFLDGEVRGAEDALAQALLLRPDARAYHDGLVRVRDLVGRFGNIPVVVPAGFSRGVLEALQPTSAPLAPIYRLPATRSFNPWVAAAAGLVLATTLFAASTMFSPAATGNGVSSSIARVKESRISSEGRYDAAPQPPRPTMLPAGPDASSMEPAVPPAMANSVTGRAMQLRDDKLELNLHVNRDIEVDGQQVYSDVLSVSALFGEARMNRSGEGAPNSKTAATERGVIRDFSTDDYIEIEVEEAKVPGLLGALGRLAANEDYGRLVVPDHLRFEVMKFVQTVADADRKNNENDEAAPAAPAEGDVAAKLSLWEQMDKAIKNKASEERQVVQERLQQLADTGRAQMPQNGTENGPVPFLAPRRKVFIRLR